MRGLLVGGVPVGDAEYELHMMRLKGVEIASYIDATVERMRGAPRGRSARRSRASRSIDPSNCRWFASRATRRHVASDAVRPEGTREGASE